MSLRDVTIARDGKRRLASVNDVTHRKCAEDLRRFWKSQLVEMRPASGEDGWFSLAHGDHCGGCHTCWVGEMKNQIKKIEPLSPYVEEPLNSKVIKSFVPELRSRYVFFEFRDSYVLSLWTFDVRFTHSHIMAMVHMHNILISQMRAQCQVSIIAETIWISVEDICISEKIFHQMNWYATFSSFFSEYFNSFEIDAKNLLKNCTHKIFFSRWWLDIEIRWGHSRNKHMWIENI